MRQDDSYLKHDTSSIGGRFLLPALLRVLPFYTCRVVCIVLCELANSFFYCTQTKQFTSQTNMISRFMCLAVTALTVSNAFVLPQHGRLERTAGVSSLGPLAASAVATSPPPLSPLTAWGDSYDDIVTVQAKCKKQPLPEFAPEISCTKDLKIAADDTAAQLQYFRDNRKRILQMMQDHSCVVFRDFSLMKTQEGFQEYYAALGMKTCLDPLHSVSARPTVNGDKNSPVYEAVNKESRKNFFIGMHNEFVGTRAPRAAAFCCFKAAETGGEFLVADGRRLFRDLSPGLLQTLYQRQIRYSVMELPFFGWMDNLPEPLQGPIGGMVKGLVSAAINAKVDFDVELLWQNGGYDNTRILQARAPRQPPIVAHPVTGDPTWFCNVHSHSSKLRRDREQV